MWCGWLDRIGIPVRCGLVLALAAVAWLAPVPACSAGGAEVPPDSAALVAAASSLGDLPGFTSTAVRDDATALYANPAGIDRAVPLGYYLAWDDGMHGRGDLATLGMTAGAVGIGYQQVRPDHADHFSRTTFAIGGGSRKPVSLGLRASREHQARVGPDESAWRWDAGLLWRPTRAFSFGALARDLTQERMFGALYRRSYAVGIGVRPLPWDNRSRATLFADLTGGEQEVWKDHARLALGGMVEPFPGLEFSGSVEGSLGAFSDDRVVRLAVGLHARRTSSWVGTRYERRGGEDVRMGNIFAAHGTVALQRSMQKEPVLARIPLGGAYGDASQNGLPIPVIGSPSYASIRPVLRDLARAERDPDVCGVLLELGPLSAGALTSEVRDAIHRVRAAGKPVVAVAEAIGGSGTYHVAAACDRVVIDRVGTVEQLGNRRDLLYFGEMLDSAGVQVEKVAHGKYKTAGEMLILSRASEGMKEALNAVIDDQREVVLADISADRKLTRERVEELADGRILDADEAVTAGLVDTLGDNRDAEKLLARLARRRGEPRFASLSRRVDRDYAWADGKKVAVLWLDGSIVSGRSGGGFLSPNTMGSETVVRQLRDLEKRRDVAAVVLRVDSPGGSGLASDQVWRAVENVKKKGKKVVVSMSRVAGSGGYYIACGAHEIFADPMTITGSIGVLGLKPNLAGFYRRHRIGVETFERGRMMGMYSAAVPLTEEQRQHMLVYIDRFYAHFLSRVAAGRPLTTEQIDAVGQGRIWTGRQALENKLIDRVGGLREAIDRARELAGLPPDAKIVEIERPHGSLFSMLREGVSMTLRGAGSLAGLGAVPAAAGKAAIPAGSEVALLSSAASLSDLADAAGEVDPLAVWAWRQSWLQRLEPGSVSQPLLVNPVLEALAEAP
jgi:protease IV